MIYSLLKSKGYKGPNDLRFIKEWLVGMDINIQFDNTYDACGNQRGFVAQMSIPPHSTLFTSDEFSSLEDALTHVLYVCVDFIPNKFN